MSELLGSFGDNELSPECLDGAQRFIRPGGVSVPQSYESFVAPVTAAKLYGGSGERRPQVTEMPYVVNFSKVHHIAEPKSVWEFVHPNHDDVIDNERYARCAWSREEIGSTSVTLTIFGILRRCCCSTTVPRVAFDAVFIPEIIPSDRRG